MNTKQIKKNIVTAGIGLGLLVLPVLNGAAPSRAESGNSASQILVPGDQPLTQKMSDDAFKSYFFQLGEAFGVNIKVLPTTRAGFARTLAASYAEMSPKEKRSFASQVKSEKLMRKLWPLMSKDAKAQQRQLWAAQARATVTSLGTRILEQLQTANPQDNPAVADQINPVALLTLKVVAFGATNGERQSAAAKTYAGSLLRLMGLPAPEAAAPSYAESDSGNDGSDSTPTHSYPAPDYSGLSDQMARDFHAGQGSGSMTSPNYDSSTATGSYGTNHW